MSGVMEYPYVDVFKSFNLWDWKNAKRAGEVAEQLDPRIGRKIVAITGSITANNFVAMPGPLAEMKSLGLRGRYVYVCACGVEERPFVVHLDFLLSDSRAVRVSLGSIFKEEKFDQLTVHLPVRLPPDTWSIVCLDTKACLMKHKCIRMEKEACCLKSVTLCANLKVARVVTSSKLYFFDTFPKDMNYKHSKKARWQDLFAWIEPFPCEHPRVEEKLKDEVESAKQQEETKKLPRKHGKKPVVPDKTPKEQLEEEAKFTLIKARSEETKAKLLQKIMGKENLRESEVEGKPGESLRSSHSKLLKMSKDNLLVMKGVIGSSVSACPAICWSRSLDRKEIAYASGLILVVLDLSTQQQRLLKGHTKPVRTLCISPNGDALASADPESIRVWEFETGRCLGMWHADGHKELKILDMSSSSKLLASVGQDAHGRDVITVWNLETVGAINSYQPQPEVLARHISCFDVRCLKFAPEPHPLPPNYEPQLCSCGKENICFWRLRKKCMRRNGVVLNKYSQDAIFTCLDYESSHKLYVASNKGMIFQVNAETEELEFVYQLHDQGIRSLEVCEAFCVTGSDDLFLRVWPLDFSEYFMEAKHDAFIPAVSIAPDNVEILCATESGTIGVLDIPNQKYRIVIRSHSERILACDVKDSYLISVLEDKTIRVWDLRSTAQLYEFASPEDQAVSIAIHPSRNLFVCGFTSGCMRLFDLEKTSVVDEFRPFEVSLSTVRYLPLTTLLIAMSNEGSIAFFNSASHQQIKCVNLDFPTPYTGLAVLKSERILATIGSHATSAMVWGTNSLSSVLSIPVTGCQIRDIAIRSPNLQLVALTTDSQLRIFSLDGKPLSRFVLDGMNFGPLVSVARIVVSSNGKYVGLFGCDNAIRQIVLPTVQPLSMSTSQLLPQQSLEIDEYLAHNSPIQAAMFHPSDPSLFVTAGGKEGVYLWNFQGDIASAPEEDVSALLDLSAKKSAVLEPGSLTKYFRRRPDDPQVLAPKEALAALEDEAVRGSDANEVRVSSSLARAVVSEEEKLGADSVSLRTSKVFAKKREMNMPMKQYYVIEDEQEYVGIPYTDPESKLSVDLIIGYNGNAHDNIVWMEKQGWISYTVKNKLVVESVSARTQEVYFPLDTDISTVSMSPKMDALAVAAGSPSPQHKKALVILYTINAAGSPRLAVSGTFALHTQGVQALEFVAGGPTTPSKYLVSASKSPENTIAVWDTMEGVLVFSEKIPLPINHLKSDKDRSFFSICGCEIDEWRIGAKSAVDHKAYSYPEYEGVLTCVGVTEVVPSEGARLLLIGTTDGRVIVYSPKKKMFVGDYPVFDSQITCIAVTDSSVIVGGASCNVLRWDLPAPSTIHPSLFLDKPRSLTVDGNIAAMFFDREGREGQVGTDIGTLWYLNWEELRAVKLQTGHLNSRVSALQAGTKPGVLMSAGSDDNIKLWTVDNCDPAMEFEVPEVRCTSLGVRNDTAIAGFEDGNIRVFSLGQVKNQGKVKICSSCVSSLCLSHTGRTGFVGDMEGTLYLISIDSLEPLAVRTQKLITLDHPVQAIDVQRLAPLDKFAAGLEKGQVKVWERTEKAVGNDAFSLAKDWAFVELDSCELNDGDGTVQVQFSLNLASYLFCCTSSVPEVCIRDLISHQFVRRIKLPECPLSLAACLNAAVVGTVQGTTLLVDPQTGAVHSARAHSGRVEAVCCTETGTAVFSASSGEIIKWKLQP